MAITRQRVSRFITSDGKPWDSHADAIGWEKRLVLLAILRTHFPGATLVEYSDALTALLYSPHLIIALAGSSAKPAPRQQEIPV